MNTTGTIHSFFIVSLPLMVMTDSIMASATWATQNGPRILDRLLPPMPCNAARSNSMAARDVLGVKIPAEGRPVV